MNISDKIKQLEEELIKLKAEFEESRPEKWQDKLIQSDDSNCYFIVSDLIEGLRVTDDCYLRRRKPEHAFKTEEQAELMVQKFLLHMEMAAFAHVMNEGWEPDWKSKLQIKWGIINRNVTNVELRDFDNDFVFGIAVRDKKIAEKMLEIFDERIRKYYNKQY